jgi:hypothetical protein
MRSAHIVPILIVAACTPAPKVEPAVVVEAFYAELLTHPVLGAPDPGQFARLAPFLGDTRV